tara:strand:- start:7439 stop:7690 length:252 start_codon:yes stop_codon:yes gene_type:complete
MDPALILSLVERLIMAVRKLKSMEEGVESPEAGRKPIDVVFTGTDRGRKPSIMNWLDSQLPTVEDHGTRAEHLERSIKRKIFG